MDEQLILALILALLGAFVVYSIVHRLIKTAISTFAFIVACYFIWAVTPMPIKASVDLTLALTGSRMFAEVDEEHMNYLEDTGLKIKFTGAFTYAFPEFTTVSNAPKVTNDNAYDFDMNFFTFDYVPRHINIVTTPKREGEVTQILKSLGFNVNKN